MLHNAPDAEHFDENIWMDDLLSEVHNDDRLWGYMIRISEQLRRRVPGELSGLNSLMTYFASEDMGLRVMSWKE